MATNWKKIMFGTWSWKRPLYSLLSIYIILCIISMFFANHLIFQAPAVSYDKKLENMIMLEKGDKKLAMLYLKGNANAPTLLWSHGNAEDLQSAYPLLRRLQKNHGFTILAYDYPGYGLSSGKPNEQVCYDAIQDVWNYLREEKGTAPENIYLVGQSVGGGPSTWLATQEGVKPAGLVLISPFKSVNSVPFGINIFPSDKFQNIKRINQISCPLLVIHGAKDSIIKQSHGKALYNEFKGNKTFINIPDAGHNDLWGKNLAYESLEAFCK